MYHASSAAVLDKFEQCFIVYIIVMINAILVNPFPSCNKVAYIFIIKAIVK